jgi:hypothetical protein
VGALAPQRPSNGGGLSEAGEPILVGVLTSFLWDVLHLRLKKKQPVTCWAHAWQATGCLMILSTSTSSLRITNNEDFTTGPSEVQNPMIGSIHHADSNQQSYAQAKSQRYSNGLFGSSML